MGAFSIPQFPIGIEMGVETTFPVYEATSSGLLVLSGYVQYDSIGIGFPNYFFYFLIIILHSLLLDSFCIQATVDVHNVLRV